MCELHSQKIWHKKGFQRARSKGKSVCAVSSFLNLQYKTSSMVADKLIDGIPSTGNWSLAFGCKSQYVRKMSCLAEVCAFLV